MPTADVDVGLSRTDATLLAGGLVTLALIGRVIWPAFGAGEVSMAWSLAVVIGLLLVVLCFFYRHFRDRVPLSSFISPSAERSGLLRVSLIGIVLVPVGWLLASIIGSVIVPRSTESPVTFGGEPSLLLFVTFIFIGPVLEETLFRGYAVLLPARLAPRSRALWVTASIVAFALSHQVPLADSTTYFVSGLLYSGLALRSRSLIPPIVAHAANNLVFSWFAFG